jgi:O-antigen/teichoic acid export membrane protein
VIVVSQAAASNVVIAVGSHKLLAGVWVGEAVVNLAVSMMLVHRIGLLGVAIGTLTPLAWGHLGVLLPRACRAVALPIRTCLAETLWPAVAGGSVSAGVCLLLRVLLPPLTTRGVLMEASATGVAYAIGVFMLGFSRAVRARYLSIAVELFRSMRHTPAVTPPAQVES